MVTSPAWFACRGRGGRPSWYAGSTAGSRGFGGWCVEQWNSITATLLVYDAHMLTSARGGRQGGGADLAGPAEPALGSVPWPTPSAAPSSTWSASATPDPRGQSTSTSPSSTA